ncbi:protein rogdi [Trichonephila clavata]|uniref:Protein rogdi n=1 Tax=Trichonephila clavata TaxID=2740835 RepID=A0A8X6K9T6_TRICU|nr:protein rogdi [Trichonephila clavata]
MSEIEDEVLSLHQEFDWLLQEEVTVILEQLHDIILECARRFPASEELYGVESLVKSEKFLLATTSSTGGSVTDNIQALVTLVGDDICYADIVLKLHKHSVPSHRTIVQNDCQWKLQQIQDAARHLSNALQIFSSLPPTNSKGKLTFHSAEEVVHVVNSLMGCLQRGRSALLIPKKRTINELQRSRNVKSLQPPLPPDLAVSFYVQSHKLVFAVYHILSKESKGPPKFDVFQAESSVPWLSEVLVLFSVSLQLCQQLKNKVSVFAQYKEMNIT